MKHRIPILVVVALLLLAAYRPAGAQMRYSAGIAANVGQPLGDFGQNVGTAYGLDGFGTIGLDPSGIFSLRAQLGFLQYSKKDETFWVQSGFGLFELESVTKSGVLTLGVGPQIMASPYRQLGAGGAPILLVCSTLRKESCKESDRFAKRARALGVTTQVIKQPLSHRQINQQLGLDGAYSDSVDAFLGNLDYSFARALRSGRSGRSS